MSSRKQSDSELEVVRLVLLGVLLASSYAAAQEQTVHSYFSDSATERMPLVTAFPKYPYVARRDRIEGEAVVCFTIGSKGNVERPTVRTATHRIFRRPAIKAIKQSSYEPLPPGQKKSFVKSCRTYRFKLASVLAENSAP
jgi:TonB family protein